MQTASSILLGGMPVSPDEVSYEDTAKYCLICPHCKEPVLLVGHSKRVKKASKASKGKPCEELSPEDYSHVASYFRHYKADSVQASECEARSLTPEGREEIKKIATASRNQRMKIFQSNFWRLIKTSIKLLRFDEKSLNDDYLGEVNEYFVSGLKLIQVVSWDLTWKQNVNVTLGLVPGSINEYSPDFVRLAAEENNATPEEIAKLDQFIGTLDKRYHEMVSKEAIEFLGTRAGIPILEKLVSIAFLEALIQDDEDEVASVLEKIKKRQKDPGASYLIIPRIVAILITVPWRVELSKIQEARNAAST